MKIEKLSELEPIRQRAVIINHNTKQVTFLALLSALRYANVPVLLVDCGSTDGSFDFFRNVMERYNFDLINLPLRKHGTTLDRIFTETRDEQLLLVDSDLEILSDGMFDFFYRQIDMPQVFGCGFLNGPSLLRHMDFEGTGYFGAFYYERPYMPCVLFKVSLVREALHAGISFLAEMTDHAPGVILRPAGNQSAMNTGSPCIDPREERWNKLLSQNPPRIFFDTGARIYEYLSFRRNLEFACLPENTQDKYVRHYWGATRAILDPTQKHKGELIHDLDRIVTERLYTIYNERA